MFSTNSNREPTELEVERTVGRDTPCCTQNGAHQRGDEHGGNNHNRVVGRQTQTCQQTCREDEEHIIKREDGALGDAVVLEREFEVRNKILTISCIITLRLVTLSEKSFPLF